MTIAELNPGTRGVTVLFSSHLLDEVERMSA
jgi:ABC-type multidrug transport system ATPase subunit